MIVYLSSCHLTSKKSDKKKMKERMDTAKKKV